MYLSQLRLDPTNSAARRDLADAYQMHRTLSRVFVTGEQDTPCRFLWRLERANGSTWDGSTVLVQCAVPGKWKVLSDQSGYLSDIHADKLVNMERLIQEGHRYRFRLRANPSIKRNGKRWGILKEEEQLAWLGRQGERYGFEVNGAIRTGCERITVPQNRNGMRITVDSVLFDGMLITRDTAALRAALLDGIGHAKALGLGMLSIAPA